MMLALPATLVGAALLISSAEPRPPSAKAVARIDTRERVVALTFDACATSLQPNTFDEAIFAFLEREAIPATVFMTGRWIEAHRDEAARIADSQLFDLGNHGYGHRPLSGLGRRAVDDEIDRAEALIASLGRKSVAVRPAFGDWDGVAAEAAAARGLPLVLWDVVSGDAGGHLRPVRIVETVLGRTKPGSIVIFHINGRGPRTHEALPAIVTGLRARGFRFVRLSELLAQKGKPVAAQPQHYDRERRRMEPITRAEPLRAGP